MDTQRAGPLTAECVTLWVGARLGLLERACLRSILRQGHKLALYCYRKPDGVPVEIEVRDASEVLPEQAVFRHRSGSVALFSDWFRYELQRRGLGTWVDTDLYLLAPIDAERQYLFGKQQPGLINNAVLRVPPTSPLLAELLRPFEEGRTPRWLPWGAYLRSRIRELAGGGADLSRLPWGSTGPHALTAVATRLGLDAKALPPEIFYPVPWQKADWILDPAQSLEEMVSERTVAVHLWNECIKSFKDEPAPEGSFLNRLHREGQE